MRVEIDGWAWLDKAELTTSAVQSLRDRLTIEPKKVPGYPDDGKDLGPILLYKDEESRIGVAREFFLQNQKPGHDIVYRLTERPGSDWPGPLQFTSKKKLFPEQEVALRTVLHHLKSEGRLGGILRASCGWGKSLWGCALAKSLQVPTLVVVHKEFLMSQWEERIEEYLPGAQVGIAQQDRCDFRGKHIVLGMVHSLAKGRYPKEFLDWPALILVDETHRISARSWAPVPPMFRARYRIGLSATPRRKDGAENVFFYHLGPILFNAKDRRLKPIIKRVYTKFRMVQTPNFNPALAPETLILTFLCANEQRNRRIVELLIEAVRAGRKILVMSKRLNHLNKLEAAFHREWRDEKLGLAVSTGYYVGGMTEEQRYKSAEARVIFATAQFAQEGLDVPALDTLFLVNPMSDVEQATGRILRPFEGKKDPIVVDFRDDEIGIYKAFGQRRDQLYARIT